MIKAGKKKKNNSINTEPDTGLYIHPWEVTEEKLSEIREFIEENKLERDPSIDKLNIKRAKELQKKITR